MQQHTSFLTKLYTRIFHLERKKEYVKLKRNRSFWPFVSFPTQLKFFSFGISTKFLLGIWHRMCGDSGNPFAKAPPHAPLPVHVLCMQLPQIPKLASIMIYIELNIFIKTYGNLTSSLGFQGLPSDVVKFKLQSYFPFLSSQAIRQRRCADPRPLCQARVQVVQRLCVWWRRVGVRSSNFFHVLLKLFFRQTNQTSTGCIMTHDVRRLRTFIFTVEISGKKL